MGFSILILSFNLFSNSILFYLFNLIFVGRLFLLILFVLSIRRLIQTILNFNFIKVLILIILILKILILNFNLFNFNFNFSFVIILGFIILLVFLIFCDFACVLEMFIFVIHGIFGMIWDF